jgi:geranylgeranyl diphosphate synthase, type II
MIHAMDVAGDEQKKVLSNLMTTVPVDETDKVEKVNAVLKIFRDCKVDEWADSLKEKYYKEAMKHLDDIAVLSSRKYELELLAKYLLQRDK